MVQENPPQEEYREEIPTPQQSDVGQVVEGDSIESKEDIRGPNDLTPEEVLEDMRVLREWLDAQKEETKEIESQISEIKEDNIPLKQIGDSDYWEYRGKKMSGDVLRNDFPEVAKTLEADNEEPTESHSDFGTRFPDNANKGDLYLRIDYMPNKLYKYNGVKWIEVDKSKTDSYAFDERYIDYLIEKLKTGEMDVDYLSASEQALVEEKLKAQDENK